MKSNCLFEAVKAKLKDPKNVNIVKLSRKVISEVRRIHFGWLQDGFYHYSMRQNLKDCFLYYEYRIKKKPIIVFQSYLFKKILEKQGYGKGTNLIKKYTKKYNLPINGKAGFTEWVIYDKENNEGFLPTIEYLRKYYLDIKYKIKYIKIEYLGEEKIIRLDKLNLFLEENNNPVFKWKFLIVWDHDYVKLGSTAFSICVLNTNYFTDKDELEVSLSGDELKEELEYFSYYWKN